MWPLDAPPLPVMVVHEPLSCLYSQPYTPGIAVQVSTTSATPPAAAVKANGFMGCRPMVKSRKNDSFSVSGSFVSVAV